MSNELTVKQAAALVPYSELERMATALVKSNLFGIKTADQAIALMLVAQAQGEHPASIANDYDIIQGRPSKKSQAMLRDFLRSGGKVIWHVLSDEKADATFSHPSGGEVRIDWDMNRARAAGLTGKDNWKKNPRQMLRSRVVSEGVRTVYPGATSGMRVPEEVQDFSPESDFAPGPFDRALESGGKSDAKPWEKPVVVTATQAIEGMKQANVTAAKTLEDAGFADPIADMVDAGGPPKEHALSTFAIPGGPHKGIKLGDKPDAFWGNYKLELEKLIPTLADDRRTVAEDTVKAIALYLERA